MLQWLTLFRKYFRYLTSLNTLLIDKNTPPVHCGHVAFCFLLCFTHDWQKLDSQHTKAIG